MSRTVRSLVVICLTAALIGIPWNDARASEQVNAADEDVTYAAPEPALLARLSNMSDAGGGDRRIWRSARGIVPSEPRHYVMRASQNVAQTNESNLILGVAAAALIIGGVALMAYGTTDSCKRKDTGRCDRDKVLGAVGISGGSVMLVVWGLSK